MQPNFWAKFFLFLLIEIFSAIFRCAEAQNFFVFNRRLAIFQLLNDIESKTDCLAFTSFCLGCINVPLYLFLLIGTIFRKSCPILFWLIFALLELLLIGIPMIIFIGIISLYLACQLHLYVLAGTLIGIVMACFICTFSSWITVSSLRIILAY